MERIDIEVDQRELNRNAEKSDLLRRTRAFEPTQRVPVVIATNQWCELAARRRTPADYFRSPVDNLREQILNRKWRIENIRDDMPIPTESIEVAPDFGCLRATEFQMEITWSADQPPKVRHPLTVPEQIDDLEVPDPAGGINGKLIEWYHVMDTAARDFVVTLNGTPLRLSVTLSPAGGPMPSAFALAGENLFIWMADEPERVQRLMQIVTTSYMRCIRYFNKLTGRNSEHALLLGGDAAEMVSPSMFERFVIPCYQLIWQTYGRRRSYHNCGRNEHLLDLMRDVLCIDELAGFGFCVDPGVLAEKLGGRVVLSGGPSPVLVLTGPPDEIQRDCRHYTDVLGACRGFILDIGHGPAPGTPLAHYEAMIDAAKHAGNPGYR